ncbi:NAD(P)H-dependent flavin oxidoreductase [Anaerobacillus sp. MEB173]|uniref:NAD(P)H-dependent flavin oxidoreductase n=1 Tax=Anaerobacillus sp. MEB173 TaxID=3383345 RepID=UPI003F8EA633
MMSITEQLNIDHPIIQGGMGNISEPALAAAISEAGGLGTIGAGTMTSEEVDEKISRLKELTARPFCVNIPINVQPHLKEIVELVLEHQVPVVSLSAGNPAPYIKMFHEQGMKVICVVSSVKQAIKAEQAGADILVAEGYEAAGINSNLETTTLTLIPQIVDAVTIPVIAAGGIGDGRGLAAMFALGASGVQMGTRFIATKEALVHENYKNYILQADDTSTVIVGRSVGRIRRLLKTPYAEKLLNEELNGISVEQFDEMTDEIHHKYGAVDGELAAGHINSGQIAGLIKDIPTVKELLNTMMEQASESLFISSRKIKFKEIL